MEDQAIISGEKFQKLFVVDVMKNRSNKTPEKVNSKNFSNFVMIVVFGSFLNSSCFLHITSGFSWC